MAIINSYPIEVPVVEDLIVFSDISGGNTTKNATIESIVALANPNAQLGYKSYTASYTQVGTSAPVVTELQNNTGTTFTWVRESTGQYSITAAAATFPFQPDKTFVNIQGGALVIPAQPNSDYVMVQPDVIESPYNVLNYRAIQVFNNSLVDATSGWLEIRIYN